MSPSEAGARRSSPGPVKVECAISPPAISFFMENLTVPFRVTEGDMAIIAPDFFGQFLAPLLSQITFGIWSR
jgi:hypothetical protein